MDISNIKIVSGPIRNNVLHYVIKSPLGIQCEVLRIKVENPIGLLELSYSMPHLRAALNAQIMNDEHNVPDFKPHSTDNELLQFLQNPLDYTSIITKSQFDARHIQLWIR
ncbi:unnamed protein product [Rotaria magnacalcarata]